MAVRAAVVAAAICALLQAFSTAAASDSGIPSSPSSAIASLSSYQDVGISPTSSAVMLISSAPASMPMMSSESRDIDGVASTASLYSEPYLATTTAPSSSEDMMPYSTYYGASPSLVLATSMGESSFTTSESSFMISESSFMTIDSSLTTSESSPMIYSTQQHGVEIFSTTAHPTIAASSEPPMETETASLPTTGTAATTATFPASVIATQATAVSTEPATTSSMSSSMTMTAPSTTAGASSEQAGKGSTTPPPMSTSSGVTTAETLTARTGVTGSSDAGVATTIGEVDRTGPEETTSALSAAQMAIIGVSTTAGVIIIVLVVVALARKWMRSNSVYRPVELSELTSRQEDPDVLVL